MVNERTETRSSELNLFNKWKQTNDKAHFQALYNSMQPAIVSAASKASYGSNLPQSAHMIWAAQSFLDALKTFDPNKGVALQTHVYGAVHQKAKRLNYLYQNLGQMPEPRALMVGSYQNEVSALRHELGREPSAAEIADRMAIGLKDVERLQKEVQKDLSLSGLEEEVTIESHKDEEILTLIYYDLTNEQRVVYDYVFGKHGKPRLIKANNKIDYEEIARRAGFSASKARVLMGGIKTKFERAAR